MPNIQVKVPVHPCSEYHVKHETTTPNHLGMGEGASLYLLRVRFTPNIRITANKYEKFSVLIIGDRTKQSVNADVYLRALEDLDML